MEESRFCSPELGHFSLDMLAYINFGGNKLFVLITTPAQPVPEKLHS